MQTDYKYWYVKKDDFGYITEVTVKFYEGNMIALPELMQNPVTREDSLQLVAKYRRTRNLTANELPHLGGRKSVTDASGIQCFVYTPEDFGVTKDLRDIEVVLNNELAKDTLRSANSAQSFRTKSEILKQYGIN